MHGGLWKSGLAHDGERACGRHVSTCASHLVLHESQSLPRIASSVSELKRCNENALDSKALLQDERKTYYPIFLNAPPLTYDNMKAPLTNDNMKDIFFIGRGSIIQLSMPWLVHLPSLCTNTKYIDSFWFLGTKFNLSGIVKIIVTKLFYSSSSMAKMGLVLFMRVRAI